MVLWVNHLLSRAVWISLFSQGRGEDYGPKGPCTVVNKQLASLLDWQSCFASESAATSYSEVDAEGATAQREVEARGL